METGLTREPSLLPQAALGCPLQGGGMRVGEPLEVGAEISSMSPVQASLPFCLLPGSGATPSRDAGLEPPKDMASYLHTLFHLLSRFLDSDHIIPVLQTSL